MKETCSVALLVAVFVSKHLPKGNDLTDQLIALILIIDVVAFSDLVMN